jgi:hypothetical protein
MTLTISDSIWDTFPIIVVTVKVFHRSLQPLRGILEVT